MAVAPRVILHPDLLVVASTDDYLPVVRRAARQVFMNRPINRRDPDLPVVSAVPVAVVAVADAIAAADV
jgi:hypothetical protein